MADQGNYLPTARAEGTPTGRGWLVGAPSLGGGVNRQNLRSVQELEGLYQVSSLDQFPDRLQCVDKLFEETVAEIEQSNGKTN